MTDPLRQSRCGINSLSQGSTYNLSGILTIRPAHFLTLPTSHGEITVLTDDIYLVS